MPRPDTAFAGLLERREGEIKAVENRWERGRRQTVPDQTWKPRFPAHPTAAYLRKVRAAGGIKKYERAHLNAFTASFAPKFSHLLPPELVRRVVEYAFHVGDYWTTSVRAE